MIIARGEITITEVYDGDNFFRAWADSSDGSVNFSTTESNRSYLGVFSGREAPTHYSQYSWTKIRGESGESAVVGILSNESHQIGTDEHGKKGNYFGAETTMAIFVGGQNDSQNWEIKTINIEPENSVKGKLVDGFKYVVEELTEDQANVRLIATHKQGKHSPIEKVFKLSKNKQGISGRPSENFFLLFNDTAVKKDKVTNRMEPEELIVQGNSIQGGGSPELREGYFKVFEQSETALSRDEYEGYYLDGLLDEEELYVLSEESYPLVLSYTSRNPETTLTYRYSDLRDLMSIKVYWYKDSDFKELLDAQTVVITSDGLDGEDSVLLTLETPDGTTVRNSTGTLTISSELFSGTETVSGSGYKWYKRRYNAPEDADSGPGWERLTDSSNYGTTGYNTNTLTIPADAITGHATFMVIVNYKGKNYRAQQSLDDITDPYSFSILGSNFFRNGQGQNTYTAKIYHLGEEIDINGGEGFTYVWNQYSTSGVIVPGFEKIGKTITLTADEYDGAGELEVSVYK